MFLLRPQSWSSIVGDRRWGVGNRATTQEPLSTVNRKTRLKPPSSFSCLRTSVPPGHTSTALSHSAENQIEDGERLVGAHLDEATFHRCRNRGHIGLQCGSAATENTVRLDGATNVDSTVSSLFSEISHQPRVARFDSVCHPCRRVFAARSDGFEEAVAAASSIGA